MKDKFSIERIRRANERPPIDTGESPEDVVRAFEAQPQESFGGLVRESDQEAAARMALRDLEMGSEAGQRAAMRGLGSTQEPTPIPAESLRGVEDAALAEGRGPFASGLRQRPVYDTGEQRFDPYGPMASARRLSIDPVAQFYGLGEGVTMGHMAELGAPLAALFPGTPPSEQIESEMEGGIEFLREASPEDFYGAEAAGGIGASVATPGLGAIRAVRAAGPLARGAALATEGIGWGLLGTHGLPGEQSAGEYALGGALGAALPAGFAIGEKVLAMPAVRMAMTKLRELGAQTVDITRIMQGLSGLQGASPDVKILDAAELAARHRLEDGPQAIQAMADEGLARIRRIIGSDISVDPMTVINRAQEDIVEPLRRSAAPELRSIAENIQEKLDNIRQQHIEAPRATAQAERVRRATAREDAAIASGRAEGITVPSTEVASRIRSASTETRPTLTGQETVVSPGASRLASGIDQEFSAPAVERVAIPGERTPSDIAEMYESARIEAMADQVAVPVSAIRGATQRRSTRSVPSIRGGTDTSVSRRGQRTLGALDELQGRRVGQTTRGARGRFEPVPEELADEADRLLSIPEAEHLLDAFRARGMDYEAVDDAIRSSVSPYMRRRSAIPAPPTPGEAIVGSANLELGLPDLQRVRDVAARGRSGAPSLEVIDQEIQRVRAQAAEGLPPPVPVPEPQIGLSMSDLQRLRSDQRIVARDTGFAQDSPQANLYRVYNRAMEDAVDSAAPQGGPGLAEYREGKNMAQLASLAEEWRLRSMARQSSNREVGIGENAGAIIGTMIGGGPGAVAGAMTSRAIRDSEKGLRWRAANLVRRFHALSDATRSGLENAATRGPSALAAAGFQAQQTDPVYRELLAEKDEIEQEADESPQQESPEDILRAFDAMGATQ